ncbi:unnamed protein product [Oreochromis niloticus]|nr:unnamed protein product [Mustela putorius furo]
MNYNQSITDTPDLNSLLNSTESISSMPTSPRPKSGSKKHQGQGLYKAGKGYKTYSMSGRPLTSRGMTDMTRSISASSVQRTLQENSDLHAKIKQTEEEKLQLEEKCRQLEARNQELEKQQQRQPYTKIISEAWEGKFGKAQQKILFLIKENKTKSAELKETSAQLQRANATIGEMQRDLQNMEQKNQALQGTLDEAMEQTAQILGQIKEEDTQMQDQLKGIKKKYEVLKVRLDETECKNKELLQEKEQQEEEKRILQDLERRNLQLNEFCNTMKDRTPELEGEVLEKLRSKMQRRINEMAKKHSEVINEMLLNSDNLKRENAEMLAQKQQQEKINEDLQRKLQEITRRNEQLENIHKEKQQQNTDKRNLLKEMEQRCQKLEKEVEETTDQLRTLILEKKVLVEKLMEKKKKRFCFFWRRDTPAFSTSSIFSTADVTSSPSTSVPS